jgi:hypothetical protein
MNVVLCLLGLAIGAIGVALTPAIFPFNLPIAALGGGMVGWTLAELTRP